MTPFAQKFLKLFSGTKIDNALLEAASLTAHANSVLKELFTDIVTERCYFEITPEGMVLRELAPGYTVEDIKACTEADFIVPDEIGVME